MKTTIRVIVCFIFIWSFLFTHHAQAKSLYIETFRSDISILEDGSINVNERIVANFEGGDWHGVYRDMPHTYKTVDGEKVYSEIDVLGVFDEKGNAVRYSVERNGANLRIKIGDPNQTVAGTRIYNINYNVLGALRSFDAYDELYWNINGFSWEVPIGSVTAVINLPEEGILRIACYAGHDGSTEGCQEKSLEGKTATFYQSGMGVGGNLTVAVGFKKGMVPIITVPPPSRLPALISFIATLVVGMVGVFWIWWRNGRDFWYNRKNLHDPNAKEERMPLGAHETIVVEYEAPDNLRPAEINYLTNEKATNLGVSATIVDLAVRGYIQIKEIPKSWIFGSADYELIKLKSPDDKLMYYESYLLEKIFNPGSWKMPTAPTSFFGRLKVNLGEITPDTKTDRVLLSEMHEKFYQSLELVKDTIREHIIQKKYFYSIKRGWAGSVLAFVGLLIAVSYFLEWGDSGFAFYGVGDGIFTALVIIGIAIFIMSGYIPQRTALGREVYRRVRGYELFINNVEKYRMQFFEKEGTYMKVLPYAMVFGATKKLAEALKKLDYVAPQPSWYVGTGHFDIESFGGSMNNLSSALSSTMASAPGGSGSGGGGSSGGGGGGGGW